MQSREQRLTFHVQKTHVEIAGEPVLHAAVDYHLVQRRQQLVTKTVAQTSQAAAFFRHVFLGDLTGFAEADNTRNIERAGAQAMLMAAAVNHGLQPFGRTATNIECAAAFRAIELRSEEHTSE